MQAYGQAVVSASKIISDTIIPDLDCAIDNGLGLDDLITEISRRVNQQVTQQAMNAASSRLTSLYSQKGWQTERNIFAAPVKPIACAQCASILG